MCNLGEGIFEQGIDQGIKQGIDQGIKQGIDQGIKQGRRQGRRQGRKQGIDIGENKKERAMLSNMILSGKLSIEAISELTGVELEKVKRVSEELSTVSTVA